MIPAGLQQIRRTIASARGAFDTLLVNPTLDFESEATYALQHLTRDLHLVHGGHALRLALNHRDSVIRAVANAAAIGLTLNPAVAHAYLVPRDGAIRLDVSYRGFVELAVRGGSIVWAQARAVHEQDQWTDNGLDRLPTHTLRPFSRHRGPVIGVYVSARLPGGDVLTDWMRTDEINAVRDRSEYFRRKGSGPWKTDWPEMAKKTVVKRARKLWPQLAATPLLDQAIHYLNEEAGEGFAPLETITPDELSQAHGFDIDRHLQRLLTTTTDQAAVAVYQAAIPEILASGDLQGGGRRFKQAVLRHRSELRDREPDAAGRAA